MNQVFLDKEPLDLALSAISKAGMKMLFREPFYAHVLSGINREINTSIPTACIGISDDSVTIGVNPDFFCKKLGEHYQVGVLKHELLHLIFGHLQAQNKNPKKLFNIAADLVVNQYLHPWPVPEGAVTLDLFKDLTLIPYESVEYI